MMGLTAKQRQLYDFIAARLRETGVAPSYREMAEVVGFAASSKGRAHELVRALEERGYIRRIPNKARAIELVPDALGDAVTLHPEVRAAAVEFARLHHMTLPTALAIAVRAFFIGDKAA